MSVAAYQKANQNTENPRQREYRAFAMLTRAMEEAEASDQMAKVRAVAKNQQLWLTLQKDLISEENGLPKELKGQLLSIALWVARYSGPAMRGEAELAPLITVNKQIMEGLRGTSDGAMDPQASEADISQQPIDSTL